MYTFDSQKKIREHFALGTTLVSSVVLPGLENKLVSSVVLPGLENTLVSSGEDVQLTRYLLKILVLCTFNIQHFRHSIREKKIIDIFFTRNECSFYLDLLISLVINVEAIEFLSPIRLKVSELDDQNLGNLQSYFAKVFSTTSPLVSAAQTDTFKGVVEIVGIKQKEGMKANLHSKRVEKM
jgi:hypothetical protein